MNVSDDKSQNAKVAASIGTELVTTFFQSENTTTTPSRYLDLRLLAHQRRHPVDIANFYRPVLAWEIHFATLLCTFVINVSSLFLEAFLGAGFI